uniref:zeta toxin family protein n=1 Tax=Nonomuraea sp. CA-251285 TaxID=3240002 RepID=UPI003F4908F3
MSDTWRSGVFEYKVRQAPWDPHKHPRDRVGRFSRTPGGSLPGISGGPEKRPESRSGGDVATMSYDEYTAYTARLKATLDRAVADGLETDRTYTLNGDRQTYLPERAAQHKAIVDDLYNEVASVPNEGRMVIAGGLGGAGKSTVLQKFAGIPQDRYATINPDDIKEKMAERGMVPEVEGLSPMEASALIHEESGLIANMLAARLYQERKNIIWDITMSRRASVEKRLKEMREAGYTEFRAVFVDIPVETSVERALARHKRGVAAYAAGRGYGGRYVPPEVIRANASATSSSANREVFEALKASFNAWEVWDNSVFGRDPQQLDSSTRKKRS